MPVVLITVHLDVLAKLRSVLTRLGEHESYMILIVLGLIVLGLTAAFLGILQWNFKKQLNATTQATEKLAAIERAAAEQLAATERVAAAQAQAAAEQHFLAHSLASPPPPPPLPPLPPPVSFDVLQEQLDKANVRLEAAESVIKVTKELATVAVESQKRQIDALEEKELITRNELATFKAQQQPRVLLEVNIASLHKKLSTLSNSMTKQAQQNSHNGRWRWFRDTYLLEPITDPKNQERLLTERARKSLDSIGGMSKEAAVIADIQPNSRSENGQFCGLVNSPHRDVLSGVGWVTGGSVSPGLASSMVLGVLLQSLTHFRNK